MYKNISFSLLSSLAFLVMPASALADSVGPIGFESPYVLGSINGQQGWSSTGSFDQGIVSSPVISGTQSFRLSNAVTSGSFGDQTFSPTLAQPAGETGADNATYGVGPFKTHFESQFSIKAIPGSLGDNMSVSPDRGDGARMSYLRFENKTDGVHVFFVDVTDPTHATNADTFNETQITVLDGAVHTVKFSVDLVDGPDNDVVKIYIDGHLKITGTSWEDYYLYDTQSNPGLANPHSRTIRTMLFRSGGTAVPANLGKGYLIDGLSLSSSGGTSGICTDKSSTLVSDTSNTFAGLDGSGNAFAVLMTSITTTYWTAAIPGATWIWSKPAVTNSTITDIETFTKSFLVTGTPTGGVLKIAADNFYSVKVNGHDIDLGAGHVSDNNFTSATTYSIPAAYLISGANVITAEITNEAVSDTNVDNNPAGLLYSLVVSSTECTLPVPPPTKDQCKDGGWKNMLDSKGNHFKNQGDCVSYFATGGKNEADEMNDHEKKNSNSSRESHKDD